MLGNPRPPKGPGRASYGSLEAQSLYCPRCGQAQPVRRKLLLVLPQGDKYAYFCAVCGEQVGSKMQESEGGPSFIIR
jgi:DNA-directed RNA polymerase subunit RPC12/RpoP